MGSFLGNIFKKISRRILGNEKKKEEIVKFIVYEQYFQFFFPVDLYVFVSKERRRSSIKKYFSQRGELHVRTYLRSKLGT